MCMASTEAFGCVGKQSSGPSVGRVTGVVRRTWGVAMQSLGRSSRRAVGGGANTPRSQLNLATQRFAEVVP